MTRWASSGARRCAERFCAAGLLLFASPIMAVCALAVLLTSGLPVFYGARRVGRRGHEFTLWKLRTMRNAAGPPLTMARDCRITTAGALLRRFRLDELPQLWNVVRGEMSLVGPRPEAPEFVDLGAVEWQEVLSVAPGLTGAATLEFLDETRLLSAGPDPIAVYRTHILPEKLAIERAWLACCSPLGDLRLLMRTLAHLASRRGSGKI